LAGIAFTSLFGLSLWGQAAQPQWKDRAEYDLFESIKKEQNPQTLLGLLQQWEQKYPASDFKDGRYELMVGAYQKLGKGKEMMDTAKAWVAANPKALTGWYWINLLTISLNDTSDAALAQGESAAKSLLGVIDDALSPARKPAQVTDDQWKQQRTGTEYVAYRTQGWIALQQKKYEDADAKFVEALKRNPNDAQASAWAGTANLRTRKLERQGIALFHFCRAAVFTGAGAFPQQTRDQLKASFEKNYINFHGDKEGMDAIVTAAMASPIPPDGFKIESKDEILLKQEEELKKTNPTLALWISIKRELSGANGATYFENTLKNSNIPGGVEVGGTKVEKLKGKVVSCDVAAPKKPKKVIVGISSPDMSEASLVFEVPLAACPPVGTELEFSGSPIAYSAEPFNVDFEVEPKDVSGMPAPPAPKKGAPKKATKKK
jgi:tetratricopeptide (TPR) repeat protein